MLVGWMPLRRMRLTTDSGARWMKRGMVLSVTDNCGSLLHQIPQQTRRHAELRQRQPRPGNLMHRASDSLDRMLALGHPGLDRGLAGDAVARHGRRQPALGVADGI